MPEGNVGGIFVCDRCGREVQRYFAMSWTPPCHVCGGTYILKEDLVTYSISVPESRIKADVERGIEELEQMLAREASKGKD